MYTSQDTRLLGIIGTPVEHTLSPKMHSYMAQKAGMDTSYLAFDVQPDKLGAVVQAALDMGALGFNITSPHKIEVMQYLYDIDPEAALMGTVNTIVNRDGRWYGYNTDGDGFVDSLILEGVEVAGRDILILGAGGSARSVAYKFARKGAASITISGRTPQKTRAILDVLEQHTDTAVSDDMEMRAGYDIVVNSTPLGMHPHEGVNPFARYDLLKPGAAVCDLIYNPKYTQFLLDGQKYGARLVNGLNMLVLQGIYAYKLFTGAQFSDEGGLYRELMDLFADFKIG